MTKPKIKPSLAESYLVDVAQAMNKQRILGVKDSVIRKNQSLVYRLSGTNVTTETTLEVLKPKLMALMAELKSVAPLKVEQAFHWYETMSGRNGKPIQRAGRAAEVWADMIYSHYIGMGQTLRVVTEIRMNFECRITIEITN